MIAILLDKIRILSLEDEPVIADRIRRLCAEFLGDRIKIHSNCDTVNEALRQAATGSYDLFLLDLNLHGEDGFELLRRSTSYSAQVIVISAYKDRALEAFDFGVTDFVAKPFAAERLKLALDRFDGKARRDRAPSFLTFRSPGQTQVVDLGSVVFIAGADQYSEVHLADGNQKLHDKSLGQFERLLPDNYLRIHKSYIVRLDLIDCLEINEGSRYFVVLKTGQKLPVGRTRYSILREKYV
ncbi:MAG: response regulator transcription factor [Alphaproteobacteria bacterium]|nr:MAG: response regulator transcription factor [Alphaproteobacteria bacterium]